MDGAEEQRLLLERHEIQIQHLTSFNAKLINATWAFFVLMISSISGIVFLSTEWGDVTRRISSLEANHQAHLDDEQLHHYMDNTHRDRINSVEKDICILYRKVN